MPSKSVYLETFGCQMNELDSELVTGSLRALGYRFTTDADAADVILYNTCSVREHAEQKVWSRLGLDKFRKQVRPEIVVGVLGCMAERDGEDLIKRMPVVDILCGPGELDKLPSLLDNAVRTRMPLGTSGLPPDSEACVRPDAGPEARHATPSARQVALQGNTSRRSATLAAAEDSLELLDLSRAVSPEDHGHTRSAYVRITRGCNKFCTYCVVPFTRGAEMHRPPRHIVDECKRLADSGVLEVTLLGQTVNHYRFEHGAAVSVGGITQPQKGRSYKGGHDRDPFAGERTTTFADLLAMIHEEVPAIRRLRFVTSYPRDFGNDVLEVIRDHPRICRYLHVPAQSGSNRILSMMNRGYTVEEYLEFLDRARSHLHQPELGRPLTIAGDIIVGFPSETEEDHCATVTLLEGARYKNCFIFKYSPRPGTIAFDKLTDDIPEAVKRRRNNALLALQQRISDEVSREYIGQTLEVFVEGLSQHEVRKKARDQKAKPHANGLVGLTIRGHQPHHMEGACEVACGCEASHIEEPESSPAAVQISARTEGDLIVHVDLPASDSGPQQAAAMIGRIISVRITAARSLSLMGEIVATPPDEAATARRLATVQPRA
ncbi:MAG: MiaB/RimO family radical SAM methylthiotransferase [Phycisphaerales bacterium]|nr:MiaB/RimO family radical SAM methylthiotransferase [Phycisphaerales bacterium]